jgi:hypothetical protein
MRALFDNIYTKADPNLTTEEEAMEFFHQHPELFNRPACQHIEVLSVTDIKESERPYEVIRHFRQNGINTLLPNYDINAELPFYFFTLGTNPYPLNSIINSVGESIRNKGKWGISYVESADKSEIYYLRVDEVFTELNKDFENAKNDIRTYCSYLKSQEFFLKQLGIKVLF